VKPSQTQERGTYADKLNKPQFPIITIMCRGVLLMSATGPIGFLYFPEFWPSPFWRSDGYGGDCLKIAVLELMSALGEANKPFSAYPANQRETERWESLLLLRFNRRVLAMGARFRLLHQPKAFQ
jgi:hypothetical protein